jgi:hypothetical protein
MDRTSIVQVLPDRQLPGVQIVGFHGKVGAEQTPARRGPVLADAEGRLLRVLRDRVSASGRRELLIETEREPLPPDELPGDGTRLSPVPARLGDYVAIVGEREQSRCDRLTLRAGRDEPPRVARFVSWLRGDEACSVELTCERVGEVVAWCCAPEEAFALWRRIQAVAEEELFRALQDDKYALIAASFWLSRAKVTDQDIYLAAAGLKRAGSPHWRSMLRAGARDRTEKDWEEGLRRAEELFANPPRFAPVERAVATYSFRRELRSRFTIKAAASRGMAA